MLVRWAVLAYAHTRARWVVRVSHAVHFLTCIIAVHQQTHLNIGDDGPEEVDDGNDEGPKCHRPQMKS